MEIKKLLEYINGVDNNNRSKSAITIQLLDVCNINNEFKSKELNTLSSNRPIINISYLDNYIKVDLEFQSLKDDELKLIWDILEKYTDNYNKDNESFPLLELIIVPIILDGQFYVNCLNPIQYPVTEKLDTKTGVLSILFNRENVYFLENPEFDTKEIKAAVEREFKEEV